MRPGQQPGVPVRKRTGTREDGYTSRLRLCGDRRTSWTERARNKLRCPRFPGQKTAVTGKGQSFGGAPGASHVAARIPVRLIPTSLSGWNAGLEMGRLVKRQDSRNRGRRCVTSRGIQRCRLVDGKRPLSLSSDPDAGSEGYMLIENHWCIRNETPNHGCGCAESRPGDLCPGPQGDWFPGRPRFQYAA